MRMMRMCRVHTAFKIWMRGVDTGVNGVCTCSIPCAVVVGVDLTTWFVTGNTRETPSRILLLNKPRLVDYTIMFNVVNLDRVNH